MLPRKSSVMFGRFVKILEADYDWLAEKLDKFSHADSPDAIGHTAGGFSGGTSSGGLSPGQGECDSLSSVLQGALIDGGIPFPPPNLVPRSQKVARNFQGQLDQALISIF